jgi:S1-C subfamily serine protease
VTVATVASRLPRAACLALALALAVAPRAARAANPGAEVEAATVRILNYAQRGDWSAPWRPTPVGLVSGSGFVIAGGRVMTNAHVVSDSRYCVIYRSGDPNPHQARVALLGHDCDLALLEPLEKGLFDGVEPLAFGGLPPLRSTVETYGYPAGGERLSSTRGVVSRIEVQAYMHSGADAHLTVQTDAAINPGNSGGPVVSGGAVVGVAFQGSMQLNNVGFFIPTEVIRHFLDDAADGRYDGYPDLGIIDPAGMENPAARRKAGMGTAESGARVFFVFPGESAEGRLQPGDVILAVDGHPVANDGSVEIEGLRLDFGVLVDRHQAGEELAVDLLRGGQRLALRIPLRVSPRRERFARAYERLPRYFVYAGLVFVPLDRETLETYGPKWRFEANRLVVHEHVFRPMEEPASVLREPVLLLRTLNHAVNAALPWTEGMVVSRVNGRAVVSLASLVEAIESSREPFQVVEFAPGGRFDVLRREEADRAGPEILKTYGIEKDRRL